MSLRRILLAGISVLVPAAALADPVSSQKADEIKGVLEAYLGRASPGQPPIVTVVPSGKEYAFKVDFGRLASRFLPKDYSVEGAYDARISLLPDGKWDIHRSGDLAFAARTPASVVETLIADDATRQIFDPKTALVVSGRSAAKSIQQSSTDLRTGAISVSKSENATTDVASVARDGGVADVRVHSEIERKSSLVALPDVRGGKQVRDDSRSSALDANVEGLRSAALGRLLGWLANHPDKASVPGSQEELRGLLKQAMPFFDNLDIQSTGGAMSLAGRDGEVEVASSRVTFRLAGPDKPGFAHLDVAFDGIKAHADRLPKWSGSLIPQKASLDAALSGYDLKPALNASIDKADLASDKPLVRDGVAAIGPSLIPNGAMALDVKSFGLQGDTFALSATGSVNFPADRGKPNGAFTVRMDGLKDVLAILADAAKTDTAAASVFAQLTVAQSFAETQADGVLSWRIDLDGGGRLTVNGREMAKSVR